jgi:protein gp37
VDSNRRQFGEKYWNKPLVWNERANQVGEVHKVFCASMADIGEEHEDWVEPRQKTFDLIEQTPNLRWLLLTKRPENLIRFIAERWMSAIPQNIWFGFSAENQEWFDKRWLTVEPVAQLFSIVFVSAEPLLGQIDIPVSFLSLGKQVWWIDGGESGFDVRRMSPEWIDSHRKQCQDAGVPYFFKQTGSVLARELGCLDKKGGDLSELPKEWGIREFPSIGV